MMNVACCDNRNGKDAGPIATAITINDTPNSKPAASEDNTPGDPGAQALEEAQIVSALEHPTPEIAVKMNAAAADHKSATFAHPLAQLLGMDEKVYLKSTPTDSLALHRWQIAHWTRTEFVQGFFIVVIVANAISIGLQADKRSGDKANLWLETVFNGVFAIELMLKLYGFGMVFFLDGENVFDTGIVLFSIVEHTTAVMAELEGTTAEHHLSGIATFRLLRLLRLMRLVIFLKRLNTLVTAFVMACADVFWVVILIIIMLYIFAVITTNFYGNDPKLIAAGFAANDSFGTVPRSMATLFQMMTLDSWMSGITRPIGDVYTFAFFFFFVFVAFASLGMLNLLTAIFVESLQELTKQGAASQAALAAEKKQKLVEFIRDTFNTFDEDSSGTLDKDEVETALVAFASPAYHDMLQSVNLDIETLRSVLSFCDVDGDGSVEYEEFCAGIATMDNEPRKKDTWEILNKVIRDGRALMQRVESMEKVMDEKLQRMDQNMNAKLDLILNYHGLVHVPEA